MKRLLMLLVVVMLFGLACADTAVPPTEIPADSETQSAPETEEEGIFPRPTVTNERPAEESYPVPALPTPDTDADYPAPEAMPTRDAYPVVEGYVWVVHPVGEQCEEERFYDTLDAAVSALEANNIEVDRATMVDLNVCLACGCPTSAHYRLHIAEADLRAAEAMGWYQLTNDEG